MNRDALTWLGCSSSIALTLLAVQPAHANTTIREVVFTAEGIQDELVECTCTSGDSSLEAQLDAEGDRAIELLGCDCAGCRNFVQQLAQSGRLPAQ
ncbi:MAG: hypothetical protein HC881_00670 [Leptolyngbyaceae cyanobacterium SL_7_1]|nr:hypothetical protein [Leptolyngbyaceae cyanobacterium SL_7_1]